MSTTREANDAHIEVRTFISEMKALIREENLEIRSLLREENQRLVEKLEPRIRELELKLAEQKEMYNTNKKVEDNLEKVIEKVNNLENFKWKLIGGGSVICTVLSVGCSLAIKFLGS